MSREEIIRMAREAGLRHEEAAEEIYSLHRAGIVLDDLERFAALVAAAEREACAALALAQKNNVNSYDRLVFNCACQDIFDAVRARGEK